MLTVCLRSLSTWFHRSLSPSPGTDLRLLCARGPRAWSEAVSAPLCIPELGVDTGLDPWPELQDGPGLSSAQGLPCRQEPVCLGTSPSGEAGPHFAGEDTGADMGLSQT